MEAAYDATVAFVEIMGKNQEGFANILMNTYRNNAIGGFVWHDHKDTDEVFIVIHGEMSIALRDGEVKLSKGEMYVIPKGVEHKPYAERECHIMLVEPKGVVNTGDTSSELTAQDIVWI